MRGGTGGTRVHSAQAACPVPIHEPTADTSDYGPPQYAQLGLSA
jgi:hypothetical protein